MAKKENKKNPLQDENAKSEAQTARQAEAEVEAEVEAEAAQDAGVVEAEAAQDAGVVGDEAENAEKEPSELESLKLRLEQMNDRLLRTLAEYENYRKRSQKEKEQAYNDSKAATLSQFLPVLDNFERAANNKDASAEDYQKGIDMIFNNFAEIISKSGVEAFGEKGEEFDPNLHSAVMHTEDENEKENVIVEVFSKGYKMGDRILRPAVVKVAN